MKCTTAQGVRAFESTNGAVFPFREDDVVATSTMRI